MVNQFLSLPLEILASEIFIRLDVHSLLAASRVCKRFHKIISTDLWIKYKQELEIAGMVDNYRCSYGSHPVTTRLEMLRERERRWAHLDWSFQAEQKAPPDISGYYDVTPGVYLLGKSQDDDNVGVYTSRFPDSPDAEVSWRGLHLARSIIDFGTSIEDNDLIACVVKETLDGGRQCQIRVVCFSYSTGTVHPLSTSGNDGFIVCPAEVEEMTRPRVSIEISGEYMVVSFQPQIQMPADMQLWDWKKACRLGGYTRPNTGLAFLSNHLVLSPNLDKMRLDIFHINPMYEEDSEDPDLEPGQLRHVYSLELPRLRHDLAIVNSQCRASPSPTHLDGVPLFVRKTRPFIDNPSTSTLIVTIDLASIPLERFFSFAFLMHKSSLVDLVHKALGNPIVYPPSGLGFTFFPHSPVEVLPWDSWGPSTCRLFPVSPLPNAFITTTAGTRWVWAKSSSEDEDSLDDVREVIQPDHEMMLGGNVDGMPDCQLEVVDFGTWKVKRFRAMLLARQDRSAEAGPEDEDEDEDKERIWYRCGYVEPFRGMIDESDTAKSRRFYVKRELVDSDRPSHYSTMPGFAIFVDQVVTRLPYVRTTFVQRIWSRPPTGVDPAFGRTSWPMVRTRGGHRRAWHGLLMDEERIIGVSENEEDYKIEGIEVLYFG